MSGKLTHGFLIALVLLSFLRFFSSSSSSLFFFLHCCLFRYRHYCSSPIKLHSFCFIISFSPSISGGLNRYIGVSVVLGFVSVSSSVKLSIHLLVIYHLLCISISLSCLFDMYVTLCAFTSLFSFWHYKAINGI